MFIPRITALILSGVFDPYSSRHIPRMIDLAEQIEAYLTPESPKYQLLLQTVGKVFRRATMEFVSHFGRLYSTPGPTSNINTAKAGIGARGTIGAKAGIGAKGGIGMRVGGFDPEAQDARTRYLARCAKLIGNIVKWRRYAKERDGLGLLVQELLVEVFVPVAQTGWEVGGLDALRKAGPLTPSFLFYLLTLYARLRRVYPRT